MWTHKTFGSAKCRESARKRFKEVEETIEIEGRKYLKSDVISIMERALSGLQSGLHKNGSLLTVDLSNFVNPLTAKPISNPKDLSKLKKGTRRGL